MHLFRIMPEKCDVTTIAAMPTFKAEACTKENNARKIVTRPFAEKVCLGNKVFKFTNFCEDGFPFLTYLSQGDCVTGEQFLSNEEARALEAEYGQEKAAYNWFKNKGYTAVICRFYDQPHDGEEIDFVWLIL